MSIDQALTEAGIELGDGNWPRALKERAAKNGWAKIIGLCRKKETEEREREKVTRQRIEDLCTETARLTSELARINQELIQERLKNRMIAIALPEQDAHFLLTGEKLDNGTTQAAPSLPAPVQAPAPEPPTPRQPPARRTAPAASR